jgi:hypothetical protein
MVRRWFRVLALSTVAIAVTGSVSGQFQASASGTTAVSVAAGRQVSTSGSTAAASQSAPSGAAIDLTRLPVGDGRLSTGALAGSVWACQTNFAGGGPPVTRPWISADGTYDLTAKPLVDGAVTWPHHFEVTTEGATRILTGNGLPDHPTGVYPITPGDDAFAFDRNPNAIREQPLRLTLPAMPSLADQPSCVPMGAIGVLHTGSVFFNALDAAGKDAVANEIQDGCGGHPEARGSYHYHNLTSCHDHEGEGHSPLTGYAFDGFGIFGLRGEDGALLSNADLDDCHGHTHTIDWDGRPVALYHYHATWQYPYTVGCYRGTPVRALTGGPGGPGGAPMGGQGQQSPPPMMRPAGGPIGPGSGVTEMPSGPATAPSAGAPSSAPDASIWSTRAPLTAPNSETAVAELDGKIYVIGGYPSTRAIQSTVQVYDTREDRWEVAAPLPVPLHHTMAAAVNGRLYVIGGEASPTGFAGAPGPGFGGPPPTGGPGGPGFGGPPPTGGPGGAGPGAAGAGGFVDTVYAYDPHEGTWTPRAAMPTARSGGAAVVHDGRIYVAGGRPPRGNDFASYDPHTDTWQSLPDLPTQRNHLAAAAIGGKIYVAGGRFGGGVGSEMTGALEVYDPATNSWTAKSPMPTARGGVNGIGANGCLYTFGGEGNDAHRLGVFDQLEVYDPARDTWQQLEPLPVAVHGVSGAAVVDGWIHLPGGGTARGGNSGSTIHQVFRAVLTCDSGA